LLAPEKRGNLLQVALIGFPSQHTLEVAIRYRCIEPSNPRSHRGDGSISFDGVTPCFYAESVWALRWWECCFSAAVAIAIAVAAHPPPRGHAVLDSRFASQAMRSLHPLGRSFHRRREEPRRFALVSSFRKRPPAVDPPFECERLRFASVIPTEDLRSARPLFLESKTSLQSTFFASFSCPCVFSRQSVRQFFCVPSLPCVVSCLPDQMPAKTVCRVVRDHCTLSVSGHT